MALDLNSEEAIDYTMQDPYLPFEAFGEYDLDLIDYQELISKEEARRREAAGEDPDTLRIAVKKPCDVATVKVLKSNNPAAVEGETVALWFDQAPSWKAEKYAVGRHRQFVAAVLGVQNPKDPTFDAVAGRQALLDTDLSEGGNCFHLSRREGTPRDPDDETQGYWPDDRYRAIL